MRASPRVERLPAQPSRNSGRVPLSPPAKVAGLRTFPRCLQPAPQFWYVWQHWRLAAELRWSRPLYVELSEKPITGSQEPTVKHSPTLVHPAYYWLTIKLGVSKELSSNHSSRRKEQRWCLLVVAAILQRSSVHTGQLKIQSVATCLFLCMDSCGLLYGSSFDVGMDPDYVILRQLKPVSDIISFFSHESSSLPGEVASGISLMGIVPDDALGGRVFLGDLPFLQPLHSSATHTHLASPSSHQLSRPPLATVCGSPAATGYGITAKRSVRDNRLADWTERVSGGLERSARATQRTFRQRHVSPAVSICHAVAARTPPRLASDATGSVLPREKSVASTSPRAGQRRFSMQAGFKLRLEIQTTTSAVVNVRTRIREDLGSNPGPAILISVFHAIYQTPRKCRDGFLLTRKIAPPLLLPPSNLLLVSNDLAVDETFGPLYQRTPSCHGASTAEGWRMNHESCPNLPNHARLFLRSPSTAANKTVRRATSDDGAPTEDPRTRRTPSPDFLPSRHAEVYYAGMKRIKVQN
ncbi:hypothetical protein PR048_014792 [Dryococelus australis]|uniref:Uncharacterized protein n=1 Tax=Dryococelus australis TaxID=614101 RepID=A0ABQ9HFY5_9NEOP|nr:hypothetical protein PR048_014792 [Dryococelus australis]